MSYNLTITTLDGERDVVIPSGWNEVSYSYYKEKIEPYVKPSDQGAVANNVRLICSILDVEADQANIMEFAGMLEKLLNWMEEIPRVPEFWHKDVMYSLPVLGKAQANGKPFFSVADWENTNDALTFLKSSEQYSDESSADVGLIILCALANGPTELDDIEFGRRLNEWKDITMDVILGASFFFLQFTTTYEMATHLSLTALTKKVTQAFPNITLGGLRSLLKLRHKVYLQNLRRKVAQ